jgi:hypothetical protein
MSSSPISATAIEFLKGLQTQAYSRLPIPEDVLRQEVMSSVLDEFIEKATVFIFRRRVTRARSAGVVGFLQEADRSLPIGASRDFEDRAHDHFRKAMGSLFFFQESP